MRILERLGLDPALAGDLREECAQGRSTIWYWRQILIAIWIGFWCAILHHKLLALRAIVTGCAVNGVWFYLWLKFLPLGFSPTPVRSLEPLTCLLLILLMQSVTGWVVARTQRANAVPMVSAFAIWLAFWFAAGNFRHLAELLTRHHFATLAWYCLPEFAVVAGLLIGGIVGAHRYRMASGSAFPDSSPGGTSGDSATFT